MLDSEIFARVFLTTGGRAYIAFRNKKIFECTARTLSDLHADPLDLSIGLMGDYKNLYKQVNPQNLPINKIPGLTLAEMFEDMSFHSYYPIMEQKLYANLRQNKTNAPIIIDFPQSPNYFEDVTQCYIYLFGLVSKAFASKPNFKHNFLVSPEFCHRAIEEIINLIIPPCNSCHRGIEIEDSSQNETFIPMELVPVNVNVEEPSIESKDETSVEVPDYYVTPRAMAEIYNVTTTTVYSWKFTGKLDGHWIVKDGKTFIDPNAVIEDGRTKRTNRKETEKNSRHKYSKKDHSYMDTQQRIAADKIVTDAIAPFINYWEEALYYKNHRYREVVINNRHALIIDINPEYFCKSLGKTNREIIMEGKSPVLPNDEDNIFELHHIGQRKNSPFAIIPQKDHNSSKMSQYFHSNSCGEDLHGSDFNSEKREFWKGYLKLYDENGQKHGNIPCLNPRDRALKNPKTEGGAHK